MTWPIYEKDGVKVYRVDEYVVSQDETWLPGAYASMEAAIEATKIRDDYLCSAYAGGTRGPLTLEDVKALFWLENK